MADDIGTGASIAFGTSSWSANIISMTDLGVERPAVDTTHLGSSVRTYMPGRLLDGGTLNLEVNHDSAKSPPVSAAAEAITITLNDSDTISFPGFITSYRVSIQDEQMTRASVAVKVAGAVTGL